MIGTCGSQFTFKTPVSLTHRMWLSWWAVHHPAPSLWLSESPLKSQRTYFLICKRELRPASQGCCEANWGKAGEPGSMPVATAVTQAGPCSIHCLMCWNNGLYLLSTHINGASAYKHYSFFFSFLAFAGCASILWARIAPLKLYCINKTWGFR